MDGFLTIARTGPSGAATSKRKAHAYAWLKHFEVVENTCMAPKLDKVWDVSSTYVAWFSIGLRIRLGNLESRLKGESANPQTIMKTTFETTSFRIHATSSQILFVLVLILTLTCYRTFHTGRRGTCHSHMSLPNVTFTCHVPLHLHHNVYSIYWIKLDWCPRHVTVTENEGLFSHIVRPSHVSRMSEF